MYFSHSLEYEIMESSHVISKKPVITSIRFTKFNYACKIQQNRSTTLLHTDGEQIAVMCGNIWNTIISAGQLSVPAHSQAIQI